jgi:microcompartment protein CcmL/EutN
MSAVQLKLYLQPQGSIRRFTVDNNTSYEQFVAQVKTFYHERVETLSFQYLDEEDDLVSFSSQNEWNAALSNHNESDAKLLRIKVKPLAIKRPQPQPRPQFCQRPSFGQQCHRPRLDEKYISRAAPLLKQIFGVDIEIEREEKPQESQPEKKEEAPQKQEEVVEEIIIPEDDEPVEQVYPTTSEKVEQPPVVEQEYEYASQLETLRNMGFTNEKLNKHLLDNFKGDLVRVVNNLVQLSLKQ